MLEALLRLKCLDDSGVNEELAIGKDACVDSVTVFLALLLLDRVDSDALHLRAELVIHTESIFLRDSLPDASFVLRQLTLVFVVKLAEGASVTPGGRRTFTICCGSLGLTNGILGYLGDRRWRDSQKQFVVQAS